jgi:predicted nucleotidyltransferase
MYILSEEIIGLWKHLVESKVRFILVGGFATNFHGFQRYTGDMDIWVERTDENRKKLREAFRNFGLGDFESLETMPFVPGWTNMYTDSGFTIDLMDNVKGLENIGFEECYGFASEKPIRGLPIKFLHLHHLIASKKAANRPKDQQDIIELERILMESGE